MDDARTAAILQALRESGDETAWCAFLEAFAPVLLQVARAIERDEDAAADAFLFSCERLAEHECARLRKFDPTGPASFVTWLRAVVRNLCIDRRRQEHGRFRMFESVARLSALHQSVFRLRYGRGLSLGETFAWLQSRFHGLTFDAVAAADHSVASTLSPRLRWAALNARPRFEALVADDEQLRDVQPPDTNPNPEDAALLEESRQRLATAVSELAPEERLMIRLRFDRGLTLAAIARVCGLRDAQQAHRHLRAILGRLEDGLAAGIAAKKSRGRP